MLDACALLFWYCFFCPFFRFSPRSILCALCLFWNFSFTTRRIILPSLLPFLFFILLLFQWENIQLWGGYKLIIITQRKKKKREILLCCLESWSKWNKNFPPRDKGTYNRRKNKKKRFLGWTWVEIWRTYQGQSWNERAILLLREKIASRQKTSEKWAIWINYKIIP